MVLKPCVYRVRAILTWGIRFLALGVALLSSADASFAQTTDTIPPSPPIGLIATAATCGQVDLSWGASTDEAGGSGLKAYIITRNDPGGEVFRQVTQTAIGAVRTTF